MSSTQRFTMPLAQGPSWLDLPCTAPGESLPQARALAAALPALAALEPWLGVDLPCPEPGEAAAAAAAAAEAACPNHLCLPFDPACALVGGRLMLPWAALKPARMAPSGLPVQWPLWPAHVRLQVLPAARLDAAGVVPAAVLLLPASFQGSWPVQVRATVSAEGVGPSGWLVAAAWQPGEGLLALPGGPVADGTAADASDAWSVWLAQPLAVDLRAWFGGCPPARHAAADEVELRRGAQPVAWGRLLPCGLGWGLCIERVASPEMDMAWT